MEPLKVRSRIPNPDELDIAKDEAQWLYRFWHGYNHISYAAIVISFIGLIQLFVWGFFFHIFAFLVMGLILALIGTAILIDQDSHLFTN